MGKGCKGYHEPKTRCKFEHIVGRKFLGLLKCWKDLTPTYSSKNTHPILKE